MWAGKIAPDVRSFLKNISCSRVHLVVNSMGSSLKDRSGFKSVRDINDNNGDEVINNLVSSLG